MLSTKAAPSFSLLNLLFSPRCATSTAAAASAAAARRPASTLTPRPPTTTTEPRDPRKPPRKYTQRSITPARRPDARLTPYVRPPRPTITRGPPPSTRPTKIHQKRIFVPHSPLPMPWLGRAPAGTKPYDPQDPPIFHVGRTGSQNLPVYVEKAGTPNLRVTVRRVTGSKPALARALAASFGFDPDKVVSCPVSAQVLIKGAGPIEKERITDWLRIKGF